MKESESLIKGLEWVEGECSVDYVYAKIFKRQGMTNKALEYLQDCMKSKFYLRWHLFLEVTLFCDRIFTIK